jgi:hypothetical protein
MAVGGFAVYYMTQRAIRSPVSGVMLRHKDVFTFIHGLCNGDLENVI